MISCVNERFQHMLVPTVRVGLLRIGRILQTPLMLRTVLVSAEEQCDEQ